MSPETRSAPRSPSMRTESGHASVIGRCNLVVPADLVHLLAFTAVLAILALLPLAAATVLPIVVSIPFGVFAVAALLATPVLAPLLIVGLLAVIVA